MDGVFDIPIYSLDDYAIICHHYLDKTLITPIHI